MTVIALKLLCAAPSWVPQGSAEPTSPNVARHTLSGPPTFFYVFLALAAVLAIAAVILGIYREVTKHREKKQDREEKKEDMEVKKEEREERKVREEREAEERKLDREIRREQAEERNALREKNRDLEKRLKALEKRSPGAADGVLVENTEPPG